MNLARTIILTALFGINEKKFFWLNPPKIFPKSVELNTFFAFDPLETAGNFVTVFVPYTFISYFDSIHFILKIKTLQHAVSFFYLIRFYPLPDAIMSAKVAKYINACKGSLVESERWFRWIMHASVCVMCQD